MQSTGAVITMPDLNNLTNNSGNSSSTNSLPGAAATTTSSASSTASASASITPSSSSLSGLTSQSSSSINDLTSLCGQQASFMTSLTNQTFHGSNPNLVSNLLVGSISNRKTAIVIKGPNFESVYNAWQELLGYLSLILIFDLKEGQDLDAVQGTKLMEQMRVCYLCALSMHYYALSITMRGHYICIHDWKLRKHNLNMRGGRMVFSLLCRGGRERPSLVVKAAMIRPHQEMGVECKETR